MVILEVVNLQKWPIYNALFIFLYVNAYTSMWLLAQSPFHAFHYFKKTAAPTISSSDLCLRCREMFRWLDFEIASVCQSPMILFVIYIFSLAFCQILILYLKYISRLSLWINNHTMRALSQPLLLSPLSPPKCHVALTYLLHFDFTFNKYQARNPYSNGWIATLMNFI